MKINTENLTAEERRFLELCHEVDPHSSNGAAFFAILCAAANKSSPEISASIEEHLQGIFGEYTAEQFMEACNTLESLVPEYAAAGDTMREEMAADACSFIREHFLTEDNATIEQKGAAV